MSKPLTLTVEADGIEQLLDERYELERDNEALLAVNKALFAASMALQERVDLWRRISIFAMCGAAVLFVALIVSIFWRSL